MKTSDINITLVDGYIELLKNLNPDSKLDLIAKLSNSMKTSQNQENDSLQSLYGAFISESSADELIQEIRQSRTFNRKTEEF